MSNDIFKRIDDDDVLFFANKKRDYKSTTPQAFDGLRWLAIETLWSRHRITELEAQVAGLQAMNLAWATRDPSPDSPADMFCATCGKPAGRGGEPT